MSGFHRTQGCRRGLRAVVTAAIAAVAVAVLGAGPALAAPVQVTVTILRVTEVTCDEGDFVPCPDDYFARVNIDNQGYQETDSVDNPDVPDIQPHWRFTRTVDDSAGQVPIVIQIWDHDDSSANDHLDVSPSGNNIDLTLDLASGNWDGDAGPNGSSAAGTHARVVFDVSLSGNGDVDGDGIPDGVERFGLRDGNGNLLADFPGMGADPCRKSIAVEIDFMDTAPDHSHQPLPAALAEATAAFDAAPVAATTACPYAGFPLATTGIDLLIDVDDALAEVENLTWGAGAEAVRDANFDRGRRPYFHYVLFGHDQAEGNGSSGLCCSDSGKDALVTLGSWANQIGLVRDQSGTLIHELGHAWGFGHGGGDGVNCKANYLSVMSYAFQTSGIPDPTLPANNVDMDGDGVLDSRLRLDLSRSALPTIVESNLNEFLGIQDGSDLTVFSDPGGTVRAGSGTGGIDWNWDNAGIADDTGAQVDLNQFGFRECGEDNSGNAAPTPGQTFVGFDDWTNLRYRAALSPTAGFSPPAPPAELDAASAAALRAELLTVLRPDLAVVAHEAAPDPVLTGHQLTYTVEVENFGPMPADDVTLTEVLPAGLVADTCTTTVGTCAATPTGAVAALGTLGVDATATVTVTTTVPCPTVDGTLLTAAATVASSADDPDPSNDSADASATASNPPPVISGQTATPDVLRPPDHKMRNVAVDYTVTDNCGTPTLDLQVASNEPDDGLGDGHTADDWIVVDAHRVRLRAERSGTGTGRIYTVTIGAADSGGGTTSEIVEVSVPKGR